jgi:hypothetical protein
VKPAPAPHVPDNTQFKRFDNPFHAILVVPKVVIVKAEQKRARTSKKRLANKRA